MTKRSELNIPGIYTITCTVTGKVYVGQAINIRKRWGAHRWHLERGLHGNHHLQRAWAKHGAAAFEFAVVKRLDGEDGPELRASLSRAEAEYLSLAKCAFNLMEARHETVVASSETRALRRRQQVERWADPDERARIVDGMKRKAADPEFQARRGAAISASLSLPEARAQRSAIISKLWASPEHRAAMSVARTNNWADEEYRAQQSASRKATWADPEVRAKRSAGLRAAHARKKAAGLPWKAT